MPTKSWSTSLTIKSSLNNFFQGSALSLSYLKTQLADRDVGLSTLSIEPQASESVYRSEDVSPDIAKTVYIYAQAPDTNASSVDIRYVSASSYITIATLQPGDWLYFPYKPQSSNPDTSYVQAYNTSAASNVTLAVMFAESGSLA